MLINERRLDNAISILVSLTL